MIDQRILEAWNKLYIDSTPEEHWNRTLIPSVEWAVLNMELRPNFLLSQAVTGHGAFKSYLHRIGKRDSPACRCGPIERMPEHVFRLCERYSEGRPADWTEGIADEEIRQYLIRTMKWLWEEEKEEERAGVNHPRRAQRRRNVRAGVPITGTRPAPTSR